MDWKEQILKGMELIKEGCSRNEVWAECWNCPFMDMCDKLQEEKPGTNTPVDWNLK